MDSQKGIIDLRVRANTPALMTVYDGKIKF